LAPKLREYITARFADVQQGTEAGQAYISVKMQPRERHGTLPGMPLNYNVARIDIIEFERLCSRKVRELRGQIDYFLRCKDSLLDLTHRGVAFDDYAPNTLPFQYRAGDAVDSLLSEAEGPSFGQVEGFRPVILLDTSGACGDYLLFVKEALKRMLYSFIVSKVRFNMIKCKTHGAQRMEPALVPPTANKLRLAEDWLDGVRPIRGSADLLEGLAQAVAPPDVDAVYILTSGLPARANVDAWLREVRARNPRGVPLHIIGIECDQKGELDLRLLAEVSQGSFRQKRYDGPTALSNKTIQRSGGENSSLDDGRVSIGGQLSILEIMHKEQDMQLNDWLEEQKCANRLLLTTCTQGVVPEPGQAQLAAQRTAQNIMGADRPPRMQTMLDNGGAATMPARPGGRDVEVSLRRDRHADPPRSRARSQPHASPMGAVSDPRRPLLLNPWDRPGGMIRVSEMVAQSKAKGGAFSPVGPSPHGCAQWRAGSVHSQNSARRAAMLSR
jgi:hypothetical protein